MGRLRATLVAFGAAVGLAAAVVTLLGAPRAIGEMVLELGGVRLDLDLPAEMVRQFLVAGLVVVAGASVAPAIGWWINRVMTGRDETKRSEAEALERQREAAAQLEKDRRDLARPQRRIADFLYATLNTPVYGDVLRELATGPRELHLKIALPLVGAGIIESVSKHAREEAFGSFGVFRLTKVACPIVQEGIDILDSPPDEEP